MRRPDRLCRKSPGRPRALSPAQETALAAYWTMGMGAREIAERLRYQHGGVIAPSTVGYIARRLGLPPRTPSTQDRAARLRWRCGCCGALAEGATCANGHARNTGAAA